MTKDQAVEWLKSRGYVAKGKNWYHPTFGNKVRRYVVGAKVLRYEENCSSTNEPHWVMLRHGYYGKMALTVENKITGLKLWSL